MITARTFDVFLDDKAIDRVCFIGAEYNAESVRLFLIEHDRVDPHIEVRQVMELKR